MSKECADECGLNFGLFETRENLLGKPRYRFLEALGLYRRRDHKVEYINRLRDGAEEMCEGDTEYCWIAQQMLATKLAEDRKRISQTA